MIVFGLRGWEGFGGVVVVCLECGEFYIFLEGRYRLVIVEGGKILVVIMRDFWVYMEEMC